MHNLFRNPALLAPLLIAVAICSPALADAPKGSWRTSPDSAEFGRIVIEFFEDGSALVTDRTGNKLVRVEQTEKRGRVRLVNEDDDTGTATFEQKTESVAVLTGLQGKHFRMAPGGIGDD